MSLVCHSGTIGSCVAMLVELLGWLWRSATDAVVIAVLGVVVVVVAALGDVTCRNVFVE